MIAGPVRPFSNRFRVVLLAAALVGCSADAAPLARGPAWQTATALGGAGTVRDNTRNAFSQPLPTLSMKERRAFQVGNSLFNENWVVAPASAAGRDGLGPLFNANSCSGCHFKDGRSAPPHGVLYRLSLPTGQPDPHYGGQFQDKAIPGVAPEGAVDQEHTIVPGAFDDGTPYTLLRPVVSFRNLAYGPLAEGVTVSARVAPALLGVGLLESVPEATVLARADEHDRDGDGISGRPNRIGGRLGRFGWKANQPDLYTQVAAAFQNDIGITSPAFSDEVHTSRQVAARAAPHGGQPEIDAHRLARVVFYMQTLAVPERRAGSRRGAVLFAAARCDACHTPTLQTGPSATTAGLAYQTIHPYTDLLLHDMGEGLADGRADHEATGREWRTPPLWGVGLVEKINGHTRFLHDGRARNLIEAILWHGGEADAARRAFLAMSKQERAALLAFLRSL